MIALVLTPELETGAVNPHSHMQSSRVLLGISRAPLAGVKVH